MKAYRILALVLCLVLCGMALIACNKTKEPTPCTDHTDADENGICDKCSQALEPEEDPACTEHVDKNNDRFCDKCNELIPETKYTVTITVKGEDEAPVAGASVALRLNGKDALSGTTDANGTVSGQLSAGKYMIIVEDLPEYWYATGNYSTVQVNADSTAFSITAVDNTPNGTTEKPFPAENAESGQAAVSTMPVGATYWFTTKGESRYLIINNENVKVTYLNTDYYPEGGVVRVLLASTDSNENTMFAVTNTANSENTVSLAFAALEGSLSNPYRAELGVEQTITVTAGTSVYYTVTANKSGWLVLSSNNPANDILLFNTTASVVANSTNGGKSTMIRVAAGDTVRITVATLTAVPSDTTLPVPQDTISFTAVVCEGTEIDPLLFWDTCELSLEQGQTLYFQYKGEAGTLVVETRDGSFYWLDGSNADNFFNEYQAENGSTFYLTNAGNRCDISLGVYDLD